MKVIIIGSKGFIGHNLASFLEKNYFHVYTSDIVHDYGDHNYFMLNNNSANVEELFQWQQFDVCINCSGAAVVSDSFKDPLYDHQLNTLNVYKHLESIKKYQKNCHYIILSSAAVYGNPIELPIKETHPLNPLSPYGLHKKHSEELVNFHCDNFGLSASIVRVFSAYGPGLKKQLFWDLYQKSKLDKVKLFGTGTESRDFIYIEDLCELLKLLILEKKKGCWIYNAASGVESNISELVDKFYNILGYTGEYSFQKNNMAGYPSNWLADIGKASNLGFSPKYDLRTGLIKYREWLRELE